jgi:SAM-dependent methyltransferase
MPNEDQLTHWAGEGGDLWAAEQARLDRMLEPFIDDLLGALDPVPGERLLDVGCGSGALALAVAGRVAPDGEVVGVDLSPQMLAIARGRAADAAVPARFEQADAQTTALGDPPFDAWMSRFGVMFFDDPAAGFANLAAALRPGGRVAFTCWQELFDNEWLFVPATAALEHVALPPLPAGNPAGAFALADPERVQSLLAGAGLTDVELTPMSRPIRLGSDGEDATHYLMHTELARILLAGADEATVARVRTSVAEALDARVGPDGVVLGGSTWLVTARR